MRIGLGQIDMGFEQREETMHLCQGIIKEASEKNVDFLVFPEMTLTGFTMDTKRFGETIDQSPSICFFQEEAKKNKVAIAFGLPICVDTTTENHCILINQQGDIIADYAKIHPFSYGTETQYYTGGNRLVSCEINGISVAPLICYDLRFPEIFQLASEKSTLLTVIASWPIARRQHWIALLQARAIECQAFVVGVNRTGTGGGLEYVGDSMVISPTGEVLAHVAKESGLTVVDIDPKQAQAYRDAFPQKADRKPALYEKLRKDTQ